MGSAVLSVQNSFFFLSPVTNSNPKPTGLYRILFTGSTQKRSLLPTSKKVAGSEACLWALRPSSLFRPRSFSLPCYKLKSETYRLIPDSFHRFHSETVTIAHFQKSCRKTLFYPSSCRIFSSAHFGGAWHYRVVLNNPIAGRLCY